MEKKQNKQCVPFVLGIEQTGACVQQDEKKVEREEKRQTLAGRIFVYAFLLFVSTSSTDRIASLFLAPSVEPSSTESFKFHRFFSSTRSCYSIRSSSFALVLLSSPLPPPPPTPHKDKQRKTFGYFNFTLSLRYKFMPKIMFFWVLVGWCVVWAPCNNDVPGDGISKLNHYICLIVFHSLTFVVMCASYAVCFFLLILFYYIQLWWLVSTFFVCVRASWCALVPLIAFGIVFGDTYSYLGVRSYCCFGWFYCSLHATWLCFDSNEIHTASNDGKKDQRFTYMKIQLAYISFIVLRKGRDVDDGFIVHAHAYIYVLAILVHIPTTYETVSRIGKSVLHRIAWYGTQQMACRIVEWMRM